MFCSKCGALIAGDAAFCQSCGNPVARTFAASPAPGGVSPHSGVGAIAYVSNAVYGGFWLRFVAHVLDGLILSVAIFAILIPMFFLLGGVAYIDTLAHHPPEDFGPEHIAPFLFLIFTLVGFSVVIQWLYFAYLESGEKQATWGKQVLGVYVTSLEGRRISFAHATGRYFAKIVTGLIPLGIGYIMAGFTERKQALHDMIAATLVLRR